MVKTLCCTAYSAWIVDTASVVAAITSLHADLGNIISEHDGGENVTYRDLVRMVRKCMR